MQNFQHKRYPATAISVALALGSAVSTSEPARADPRRQRQEREVQEQAEFSFVLGPWVYKRINAAYEAVSEDDLDRALEQLDRIHARRASLNPYEVSLMWHAFGHVRVLMEDNQAAIDGFARVLELDALEPFRLQNTRFTLAQLYLTNERWSDAATVFRAWLAREEKPTAEDRFIIGHAFIKNNEYEPALTQLEVAVAERARPPEAWLQTLGAVQYELKRLEALPATLTQLIELYPSATYWLQLSQTYQELNQEDRALAVLQLGWRAGYVIDPASVKTLAQLLIYRGLPYEASRVLEAELDAKRLPRTSEHLTLLADAHVRAKNYDDAVAPLSEAARLSKTPKLYVRLTRLYIELERWRDAISAGRAALASRELDDPSQSYLLLGIAYYQIDQYGAALRFLRKAIEERHPTNSTVAAQWHEVIQAKAAYLAVSRRRWRTVR